MARVKTDAKISKKNNPHGSSKSKGSSASGEKKVRVAKGVKIARGKQEEMRKRPGSSAAGKYKKVAPTDFAGKAGGSSKFSFPINTLKRARNALARAHFSPNPEGIKQAVYKKWPILKKRKLAREKNKK